MQNICLASQVHKNLIVLHYQFVPRLLFFGKSPPISMFHIKYFSVYLMPQEIAETTANTLSVFELLP